MHDPISVSPGLGQEAIKYISEDNAPTHLGPQHEIGRYF